MKPDYRSTSSGKEPKSDKGRLCDRLSDDIFIRMGVQAAVRFDSDGLLRIRTRDYADWLLARMVAVQNFGFARENVLREE